MVYVGQTRSKVLIQRLAALGLGEFFDAETSSYTYLLADDNSRDAVIIDPVLDQLDRDLGLISDLGLTLRYAVDTHVHADHVTASGALRDRLGARTVLSERAGVGCADDLVRDGDVIQFGRHGLVVRETPGHTSGCLTYVTLDRAMAFTGDALLIRSCGRTDFHQGNAATLYRSIHDKVFSLSGSTLVYPAHDYRGRTVTTVDEELRCNPRLGGGASEAGFVAIMNDLKLAYPKHIAQALPRNQHCGFDPISLDATPARGRDPMVVSSAGIPEVSPEWLRANLDAVAVLDVREPDELRGELGKIRGAAAVPLDQLPGPVADAPRDRPLAIVCRSGWRSGKAAL